jgi:hypothetical protein
MYWVLATSTVSDRRLGFSTSLSHSGKNEGISRFLFLYPHILGLPKLRTIPTIYPAWSCIFSGAAPTAIEVVKLNLHLLALPLSILARRNIPL